MKAIHDELKVVLEHFITVFNNLEWEKFIKMGNFSGKYHYPFIEKLSKWSINHRFS